jgi:hypothetical protein
MFFVAGVLAVLAGLFYAAGHHELGRQVSRCADRLPALQTDPDR